MANISNAEEAEIATTTPTVVEDEPEIYVAGDQFNIIRTLGKGAFGTVKRATHLQTNRRVAIKIMYMDKFSSENKRRAHERSIHNEIKAMQKLNHPNVIDILGFDLGMQYNQRPCITIVQELAESGDLFEYLMHTGKFAPRFARYCFQKIMNGLRACHDQGIVHRDLKPENILLSQNFELKLADFGFAYRIRNRSNFAGMSTECGTPGYMAPEIGQARYSAKVDIFASGVILFILLTGFPPFKRTNANDWWFQKIMINRWDLFWAAHERRVQFSDDTKELFQGMLAAEADERFDLTQVLSAPWVQDADVATKPQFILHMEERLQILRLNRTARDNISDALEAYFLQTDLAVTSLDTFTRNTYRDQFQEADDEESLRDALESLAEEVPALGQMLDSSSYNLDVEGCLEYLHQLYDAENLMALLHIPLNLKSMANKILEVMNSTQLGIALTENTHQFVQVENHELPLFDDNVTISPGTYRIRVGMGTIGFLLLSYRNQISANLDVDAENATIRLSTEVQQTLEIPNEESPTEFSTVEEVWPLEIVIRFYRDAVTEENPKPYNVMTISNGDNSLSTLQVQQEFKCVVDQIINETNVGICIVNQEY